jgi:hypothetical protein
MGADDWYIEFGKRLTGDIRDLISLQDVIEELELGPNGGLVYCFEYLFGLCN